MTTIMVALQGLVRSRAKQYECHSVGAQKIPKLPSTLALSTEMEEAPTQAPMIVILSPIRP
jgi:hypothetical protein